MKSYKIGLIWLTDIYEWKLFLKWANHLSNSVKSMNFEVSPKSSRKWTFINIERSRSCKHFTRSSNNIERWSFKWALNISISQIKIRAYWTTGQNYTALFLTGLQLNFTHPLSLVLNRPPWAHTAPFMVRDEVFWKLQKTV